MSSLPPPQFPPLKPALNTAVLPMNQAVTTPAYVPPPVDQVISDDATGKLVKKAKGLLPRILQGDTYVYTKKDTGPAYTQIAEADVPVVREAVAHNETGGVKNPYAFSRSSGSTTQGRALGRYQVTEGELKTYSDRFLGHPVTAATFLAHPEIQDQYMENKIQYMVDKKLPLEKVLVAHRGGFSDFGKLDSQITQYKGYVDKGVSKFNDLKTQQNEAAK